LTAALSVSVQVGPTELRQKLRQCHNTVQIGMECVGHMLVHAKAGSVLICNPAFHVSMTQLRFLFVQERR